jgi:hypothetical protein
MEGEGDAPRFPLVQGDRLLGAGEARRESGNPVQPGVQRDRLADEGTGDVLPVDL